ELLRAEGLATLREAGQIIVAAAHGQLELGEAHGVAVVTAALVEVPAKRVAERVDRIALALEPEEGGLVTGQRDGGARGEQAEAQGRGSNGGGEAGQGAGNEAHGISPRPSGRGHCESDMSRQ